MKTNKRFTASEIVTYRLSNFIKLISFDTLEEAKTHIEKERELHPRSKKFNPAVFDSIEKKSYKF
jgi:hypothetical protein